MQHLQLTAVGGYNQTFKPRFTIPVLPALTYLRIGIHCTQPAHNCSVDLFGPLSSNTFPLLEKVYLDVKRGFENSIFAGCRFDSVRELKFGYYYKESQGQKDLTPIFPILQRLEGPVVDTVGFGSVAPLVSCGT
jgi:hypothetical protein